jgi:hypothetical protein
MRREKEKAQWYEMENPSSGESLWIVSENMQPVELLHPSPTPENAAH